ncbi:cohesin subunit SA-1 [Carpediemonas membranifera]|uniref:Cohesin subunit SA-1 n=1 Tax=Carpediemonas membranifera TaxID=201153 RepID=A0A8J6API0_9EUKA|nr:cohesin subunit SA-1 [Carpediemonas membranifera]|eukprot:KAG9389956.1 cohesin subunit SA-1 [Carpediemonas membranifera]
MPRRTSARLADKKDAIPAGDLDTSADEGTQELFEEDSAPDFSEESESEAPQPVRTRKRPVTGARPRARGTSTATLGDTRLYNILTKSANQIPRSAGQWVNENLVNLRGPSTTNVTRELVQLILDLSIQDTTLEEDEFDAVSYQSAARAWGETAQLTNPPLLSRNDKYRRALAQLIHHLVKQAPKAVFVAEDSPLAGALVDWLIHLCGVKHRPLRVTALLVTYELWTQYVARSIRSENKRSEDARDTKEREHLVEAARRIYREVFCEHYRDVNPLARIAGIKALCSIIVKVSHGDSDEINTKNQETYLGNTTTKYVGWTLSDTDADVRKAAFAGLKDMVDQEDLHTTLLSFYNYFCNRVGEAIDDKDLDIAVDAVHICTEFLTHPALQKLRDVLKPQYIALVDKSVLQQYAKLADNALIYIDSFVFGVLASSAVDEAADRGLDTHPTRVQLETFMNWARRCQTPASIARFVPMLCPKQPCLTNWPILLEIAQEDREGPAVKVMLHAAQWAAGIHAFAPEPEALIASRQISVGPAPDMNEELLDSLTATLLEPKGLGALLDEYTNTPMEASVLEIVTLLAGRVTLPTLDAGKCRVLESVVRTVGDTLQSSIDQAVCDGAVRALRALARDGALGQISISADAKLQEAMPSLDSILTGPAPLIRIAAIARNCHREDVDQLSDEVVGAILEALNDPSSTPAVCAAAATAIFRIAEANMQFKEFMPRLGATVAALIRAGDRATMADKPDLNQCYDIAYYSVSTILAYASNDEEILDQCNSALTPAEAGTQLIMAAEEVLEMLEDAISYDSAEVAKKHHQALRDSLMSQLCLVLMTYPAMVEKVFLIMARWQQHEERCEKSVDWAISALLGKDCTGKSWFKKQAANQAVAALDRMFQSTIGEDDDISPESLKFVVSLAAKISAIYAAADHRRALANAVVTIAQKASGEDKNAVLFAKTTIPQLISGCKKEEVAKIRLTLDQARSQTQNGVVAALSRLCLDWADQLRRKQVLNAFERALESILTGEPVTQPRRGPRASRATGQTSRRTRSARDNETESETDEGTATQSGAESETATAATHRVHDTRDPADHSIEEDEDVDMMDMETQQLVSPQTGVTATAHAEASLSRW